MICLTSLAGSAVGRRRSLHAALLAAALLTTIPGLPAARAVDGLVTDFFKNSALDRVRPGPYKPASRRSWPCTEKLLARKP